MKRPDPTTIPTRLLISIALLFGALACTESGADDLADAGEPADVDPGVDGAPIEDAGPDAPDARPDAAPRPGRDLHHCLKPATGAVPADPYQVGEVSPTADYGRFTKALVVYGFTLVAKDDVSDDFLRAVRQTVLEMFPDTVPDPEAQAAVLNTLYAHRAVIPVFAGGERGIDEQAIESMGESHSVCDIIMQGSHAQVMEVVEHLLHFTTDIALHTRYPAEWGMTDASTLYTLTRTAQDDGLYDTRGYADIPLPEREGIVMQEFAYWIITTAWDLQVPYGLGEAEWSVRDPADLEARLPAAGALIEATVSQIMASPSRPTLDALDAWAE